MSDTQCIDRKEEMIQAIDEMTDGNLDMVGRLCLEMSKLRKEYGVQAAKLEALKIQNRELQNKLETILGELRQIKARAQRPGDFVRTLA